MIEDFIHNQEQSLEVYKLHFKIKIMNQIKYIFILFFVIIFSQSCGDKFLDKSPIVGETEENFYRNEEDALSAVNAAYAALQFERNPAGHFRWFWGDIMSDESIKGGSGDNDVFELTLLETFQTPTNGELLESEWKASYEGIYRANVVLENVPPIEMNENLKNRILAEARFIRCYFFYNLTTMFGGVPLADRVLEPNEYNLERSTEEEMWQFIEGDLLEAISHLPLKSEYISGDIGRITKGAAEALLLKSYIWQKKWTQAKTTAESIVNSGEYALEASYAGIFTNDGENGSGSVFEIQYMTESGGTWDAINEGTLTNVFQRARGAFDGFGFNVPTQELVDVFFKENSQMEDPRLKSTVFRVGDVMGDRGIFTKEATGFDYDYYPKKYFNSKNEEATFGDPAPNGGSNDRVIRYADILLLHAEACYHTGNESLAKMSLNMVRERARGTNTNILPDITANGSSLLEAIYTERQLELALEGHRFFDLVRTDRALDVLGSMGYTDGKHNLFPIPVSQIQATNQAITQNPGY